MLQIRSDRHEFRALIADDSDDDRQTRLGNYLKVPPNVMPLKTTGLPLLESRPQLYPSSQTGNCIWGGFFSTGFFRTTTIWASPSIVTSSFCPKVSVIRSLCVYAGLSGYWKSSLYITCMTSSSSTSPCPWLKVSILKIIKRLLL